MKKIILGSKVVVSDPCYQIPTWCRAVIDGVLPGEYNVISEMTEKTGGWGRRNQNVVAIHSDYLKHGENVQDYDWVLMPQFNIGVDSGQCGIFDFETFRNDAIADSIEVVKETDENGDWNYEHTEEGDAWYDKMCQLTLMTIDGWGSYDKGVNASSGYGEVIVTGKQIGRAHV